MKTPLTYSKVEYINMVFLQYETAARPSHCMSPHPNFTTAIGSLKMHVYIHGLYYEQLLLLPVAVTAETLATP